MHAQNGRGARDVSAGLFEAARDVTPLELASVFAEVCREWHGQVAGVYCRLRRRRLLRRLCRAANLFGQVLRLYLAAFGENHRALDGVAQLTYVAGPCVLDELA